MASDSRRIPLAEPLISGREWEYVKECLDTNFVSSVGPAVTRFEEAVAAHMGRRFGIATVNGTAALHVALLAAGVGPDDEVIVPALTFIAPANAVRYAGAWPLFVDVEPDHWQIDVNAVAAFLGDHCERRAGVLTNRGTGRRVTAIVPVDLLGHPCDMDSVLEVARRHGLRVVEDATESLGASYRGAPAGSRSDVACLSFNGNKIITTGGGGLVVTDDERWASRVRYLTTQAKDDPLEYVHEEIGYNYRLTNVLAAIGLAQFERLGEFVACKRDIAGRYARAFDGVPGIACMREAAWAASSWWLPTILIDRDTFGMGSRDVMASLRKKGIEARPLWQPMHLSPAHADAPRLPCPVADRLYRDALSLPSSVGLTDADQQRVIEAVMTARHQNA